MPDDSREGRADHPPLMLAWGVPSSDVHGSVMDVAVAWVPASVFLGAWTALALLLTS